MTLCGNAEPVIKTFLSRKNHVPLSQFWCEKVNISNTERVPRKVVALALNISERHVTRLTREKVFVQPARGRYDLFQCIQAYGDHIARGGVSTELVTARQKFEQERYRRLRIENDRAEGSLLPTEAVQRMVMEAMQIVASQLDGLGGRLAGKLAGMSSPGPIRQLIFSECRRIRASAADRLVEYARLHHGTQEKKSHDQ